MNASREDTVTAGREGGGGTASRGGGARRMARACASLAMGFALAGWPARAWASGALDAVAQDAAAGLVASASAAVVVVAAPLVSDAPAPGGDEMAVRIAALVAGKLGAGARAHPQTAQLATARALAGRASALVFVQSEIAKGDLRTTVDVYPSMANAWDRIRDPLPSPVGHSFATAKIDAEVRSFLAPLVLEQASIHRARHDEGEVLAAACGDVDGDGGDEVVLVSRARVAMGRVRAGRFVAERTAAWSALAPRAPVPMREPLAGAVIALGGVSVGSTDRADLRLTPDFAGHTALAGVPAWSSEGLVCLVPQPAAGAFDGAPIDCAPARDARPRLAVPAPRFDAFASSTIVDAQGAARPIVTVREPSGRLRVRLGDAVAAPEGDFGAELAVGDLDQDGVPEVVTTVDGADDAVNVFSVPAVGAGAGAGAGAGPDTTATANATTLMFRGRLHLATPAPVRALAVCPPEEGGEPVLVAVVGSELWLIRAGVRSTAAATGARVASPGTAQ